MESQLSNLITAIWTFIIVFALFVFMIGSVLLAEFMRRERTATKDDDWVERKEKDH